MVLAVPVAIGIALFITQYAPAPAGPPGRLRHRPAGRDPLDHLRHLGHHRAGAADPAGAARCCTSLGGFPLFADQRPRHGTIFTGGVVLAVMILPIVTAISRDVFERTPRANIEAAWALGATNWEMIRLAVLPYGRPGLVSGAMLGLGRALGETIAISLILSKVRPATVLLLDLRRRRDVRLQDRQQRRGVQQPEADRRLHRRRPGAVRPDLRRQRRGPRGRQPPQGVLDDHRDSCDRLDRVGVRLGRRARARSRTARHRRWSGRRSARAGPAGLAALDRDQQRAARHHPYRLVHRQPARHHLPATRAAARWHAIVGTARTGRCCAR